MVNGPYAIEYNNDFNRFRDSLVSALWPGEGGGRGRGG